MFRMSARSAACVVLVRLDVQANQPSLRIPLPEFRPLGQQRSSPAAALIHPRLVIRDEEDQIRLRLPLVQKTNRSAAVRAASADRSQPSGVRHHAVARIQIHRNNCLLERQHGRGLVLPQHRRSDQRRHIDAPHAGRRAGPMSPSPGSSWNPKRPGHTTTRPSIDGTLAIASSIASCRASRTSPGTAASQF